MQDRQDHSPDDQSMTALWREVADALGCLFVDVPPAQPEQLALSLDLPAVSR